MRCNLTWAALAKLATLTDIVGVECDDYASDAKRFFTLLKHDRALAERYAAAMVAREVADATAKELEEIAEGLNVVAKAEKVKS